MSQVRLRSKIQTRSAAKVNAALNITLSNKFTSLEITDSQDLDMSEAPSSQQIIKKFLEESEESEDEGLQDITDEGPKDKDRELSHPDATDQDGRAASLEFTQAQVDDLKEENKILRECLGDLEVEMLRNKYAITKVEGRQDKLDMLIKKKNIIVEGLHESRRDQENPSEIVDRLFEELGVNCTLTYDQAYRIGPFNDRKSRPFLISFQKQKDRDYVFSLRTNLRGSENFYNVCLTDDVAPTARRAKSVIRQVNRMAKDQGAHCTSTPFSLTIDRQKYEVANLDMLPDQFSLEKIKTKQVTDNIIAYHSEHSPFSNLYPCIIHIASREFTSLEQLFQFKRAKRHNRSDLAEKIYLSRDAYEIRQLGAEAGKSEEWRKLEQDVMYAAMLRKFKQNPELMQKLLDTGDMILVEATPDKTWGAGVSLTSKALKKGEFPGENRQGKLLMKARDKLRAEAGAH